MTHVGRGLRVLAVMCVLATLLGVTIVAGGAQEATPTTGTEQAATDQGTNTSQPEATTPGTDGSQGEATTTTTDEGADPTATTGAGADSTVTTDSGAGDASTADTTTGNQDNGTQTGTLNADATLNKLPPIQYPVTGDGTPATDPTDVDVTVLAYQCATTADAADPANNCTPAGAGVVFNVTDTTNASKQQATTDQTGSASFKVPSGDSLTIAVDTTTMPAGYTLNGNAAQTVTAADGITATFTFVGTASTEGKVQVVNLSCPTNGPTHTQWRIIEPHTMSMMAQAQMACTPTEGASFTFSGGGLTSDQTVTTDSSGTWKGTLPPATYTITEDATSETNSITVESSGVSVAIAVDYIHQESVGTLDVKSYTCPAAADSTTLSVSQPGQANDSAPGANCSPADASFQLNSGNPFSVGADGEISIPTVPEGSYTLLDVASGQTIAVDIVTGETTSVVALHYVAMGSVSLTDLACANQVPAGQDSSDPSYWQQNCTSPAANVAFSLLDSGGNTVASGTTGQDGTLDLGQVKVGTYRIVAGGAGVCAVFVKGADASNGFTVGGGATVAVTAYSCTYAAADTGGNTGQQTTGDGTGETDLVQTTSGPTNTSQTATTGTTTVSQLPNTGAGAPLGRGSQPLELPIALLILGGAAIVVRRRQTRAA